MKTNDWMKLRTPAMVALTIAVLSAAPVTQAQAVDTEFRGLWFENVDLKRTQADWDGIAAQIAGYGFSDVMANLVYAGGAYYQSDILPHWKSARESEGGDSVRLFINAMHKYDLKAHVWVVAYNGEYGVDQAARTVLRANDGLAQAWNPTTKTLYESGWLNYNSPYVQDRLHSIVTEVVTTFPDADGVHLDYIRSKGDAMAYNASSRVPFNAATGLNITAEQWPYAVSPGHFSGQPTGAYFEQYRQWQASNVTDTVDRIYTTVKELDSEMMLSAAVFTQNTSPAKHAQDWVQWADMGIIDALMPMTYTNDVSKFVEWANRDRLAVTEEVPGTGPVQQVPVYPAINFTDINLTTEKGLEMIELTRQMETGGFMFYRWDQLNKRTDLPTTFASVPEPGSAMMLVIMPVIGGAWMLRRSAPKRAA